MKPSPTYELDAQDVGWLIVLVMLLFIGTAPLFAAMGVWAAVPMQLLVLAGPPIGLAYARTGSLGATLRVLGIRPAPRATWLGAVLIGCSFWLVSVWLIIPLIEQFVDMKEAERQLRESLKLDETPLAILLVSVAVVPAVCEELLLRGAVARGLRSQLGVIGALVISSALFGLMHIDLARLIPMTLFGLVLGLVTLTSDSCVPSMLVHLLNNAIVVVGDRIPRLEATIEGHPNLAGGIATIMSVSGLILVWRARKAPGFGSSPPT